MNDFITGLMFGVLAILICIFVIDPYKLGAIEATKGEYVCQYNEFADNWDCKEAL